jgi:hypothetical protein
MEDTYLLTMRCPVYRRRDSHSGSCTELETLIGDVKGKRTSGDPTRPKVPMRRSGSDRPILVMKWGNAHGAKGAGHSRQDRWVNRKLEEPTVLTEDGSLQWVARAGYVERPKSGSVRRSGCDSPDLLGSPIDACAISVRRSTRTTPFIPSSGGWNELLGWRTVTRRRLARPVLARTGALARAACARAFRFSGIKDGVVVDRY